MKTAIQDVPVLMDALGAKAQVLTDFGSAEGAISAEHFEFRAGVDLAPLLVGLEGDLCQAAHWGYVIRGRLLVSYQDGTSETCRGGDLLHWPAGHTVRAEEDSEFVLFSDQGEHQAVLSHVGERMATMPG